MSLENSRRLSKEEGADIEQLIKNIAEEYDFIDENGFVDFAAISEITGISIGKLFNFSRPGRNKIIELRDEESLRFLLNNAEELAGEEKELVKQKIVELQESILSRVNELDLLDERKDNKAILYSLFFQKVENLSDEEFNWLRFKATSTDLIKIIEFLHGDSIDNLMLKNELVADITIGSGKILLKKHKNVSNLDNAKQEREKSKSFEGLCALNKPLMTALIDFFIAKYNLDSEEGQEFYLIEDLKQEGLICFEEVLSMYKGKTVSSLTDKYLSSLYKKYLTYLNDEFSILAKRDEEDVNEIIDPKTELDYAGQIDHETLKATLLSSPEVFTKKQKKAIRIYYGLEPYAIDSFLEKCEDEEIQSLLSKVYKKTEHRERLVYLLNIEEKLFKNKNPYSAVWIATEKLNYKGGDYDFNQNIHEIFNKLNQIFENQEDQVLFDAFIELPICNNDPLLFFAYFEKYKDSNTRGKLIDFLLYWDSFGVYDFDKIRPALDSRLSDNCDTVPFLEIYNNDEDRVLALEFAAFPLVGKLKTHPDKFQKYLDIYLQEKDRREELRRGFKSLGNLHFGSYSILPEWERVIKWMINPATSIKYFRVLELFSGKFYKIDISDFKNVFANIDKVKNIEAFKEYFDLIPEDFLEKSGALLLKGFKLYSSNKKEAITRALKLIKEIKIRDNNDIRKVFKLIEKGGIDAFKNSRKFQNKKLELLRTHIVEENPLRSLKEQEILNFQLVHKKVSREVTEMAANPERISELLLALEFLELLENWDPNYTYGYGRGYISNFERLKPEIDIEAFIKGVYQEIETINSQTNNTQIFVKLFKDWYIDEYKRKVFKSKFMRLKFMKILKEDGRAGVIEYLVSFL